MVGIEGAFNKVKISLILEALNDLGIGQRIIKWLGNMLNRCWQSHKFLCIGSSKKVVTKCSGIWLQITFE